MKRIVALLFMHSITSAFFKLIQKGTNTAKKKWKLELMER